MRSLFRIFSLFIASFGEINTIKSCSKELRELGESQWLGFIFSKKWKKPPNNTVVCRHIWLKCTNSFPIEVTAGTRKRHWDVRTDFTCDMSYIQVYCLFFLFLLSNSLSMPHVLKSPFSLAHFSQRLGENVQSFGFHNVDSHQHHVRFSVKSEQRKVISLL